MSMEFFNKREFFCACCGLFFITAQYNDQGYVHVFCPNEECEDHKKQAPPYAVDTLGFFHYADSNGDRINKIKWSSLKYAPASVIEVYKKQGIPIRDDQEEVIVDGPDPCPKCSGTKTHGKGYRGGAYWIWCSDCICDFPLRERELE